MDPPSVPAKGPRLAGLASATPVSWLGWVIGFEPEVKRPVQISGLWTFFTFGVELFRAGFDYGYDQTSQNANMPVGTRMKIDLYP